MPQNPACEELRTLHCWLGSTSMQATQSSPAVAASIPREVRISQSQVSASEIAMRYCCKAASGSCRMH